MENTKDSGSNVGGLFVPAGIMLGMGIGFLLGNLPAGLFIGLGSGFVFMALASIFSKQA